jgi:hypothetical protein
MIGKVAKGGKRTNLQICVRKGAERVVASAHGNLGDDIGVIGESLEDLVVSAVGAEL